MKIFLEQFFIRNWKWFVLLAATSLLFAGMNLEKYSEDIFVSEVIIEFRSLGTKTQLNPGNDKMLFKEGFFDQDVRSAAIWYSTLSKSPVLINSLIPVIQKKLPKLNHSKLRSMMKVEWIRRTAGMILRIEHKNLSISTFIVNQWAKAFVSHISKQRKNEVTASIKQVKVLLKPAEQKLFDLNRQKQFFANKSTLAMNNDLVFQKNNAVSRLYSLHDKLNDVIALPRTFLFSLERDLALVNEWILLFNETFKKKKKRKKISRWSTRKSKKEIFKDLKELKVKYVELIKESRELPALKPKPDFGLLVRRLARMISSLDPLIVKNNLILVKIKKENSLYLEGTLIDFFRNQVNNFSLQDLERVSNVKFDRFPEKILAAESLRGNLKDGIIRVENNKVRKENLMAKIIILQEETEKISKMQVKIEKIEDDIKIQKRLVSPLKDQLNQLLVERTLFSGTAKIESLAYESLSKKLIHREFLKLFMISFIFFFIGFCLLFIKDKYQNYSKN